MQQYERNNEKQAPLAAYDDRFRNLLGPEAWAILPLRLRQRFGARTRPGETIVYAGEIIACRRSFVGRFVAQCARLIGAPLPLSADTGVAAIVSVMEDGAGGQFWTRTYMRRRGFPQVIHSRKSFAGATGLEEHLGFGFGVALDVAASAEALCFSSRFYFVAIGARRARLPVWLTPGALHVGHSDRADGGFAFTLSLRHRWFGEILSQTGIFRERLPDAGSMIASDHNLRREAHPRFHAEERDEPHSPKMV